MLNFAITIITKILLLFFLRKLIFRYNYFLCLSLSLSASYNGILKCLFSKVFQKQQRKKNKTEKNFHMNFEIETFNLNYENVMIAYRLC